MTDLELIAAIEALGWRMTYNSGTDVGANKPGSGYMLVSGSPHLTNNDVLTRLHERISNAEQS